MILVEDVDGDADRRRRRSPPPCGCQVRGSSDGTSRQVREVDDHRRLAGARQRSHGPETSRAVGQRRFSATSHAAMQSVSVVVGLEIAGERDARVRGRGAGCRRAGRSGPATSPASSRRAVGRVASASRRTPRRICGTRFSGVSPPKQPNTSGVRRDRPGGRVPARARRAASRRRTAATPWPRRIGVDARLRHVALERRRRGARVHRDQRATLARSSRVIGQS